MLSRYKLLKPLLILLLAGLVIYLTPLLLFRGAITTALDLKLKSLENSGFRLSYGRFDFNIFNGNFSLHNVTFNLTQFGDSTLFGNTRRIELKGLKIRKLLKENFLEAKSLTFVSPMIHQREGSDYKRDSVPGSSGEKIAGLHFVNFVIRDGIWDRMSRTRDTISVMDLGKLNLINLKLLRPGTPDFKLLYEQIAIRKLNLDFPSKYYRLEFPTLTYNRAKYFLQTDSITLIPTLTKQAFSQTVGKQVDRIKASISNVFISGFDINILTPLTITGSRLQMSFFVQAYRDKSLPFTKSTISPLPAQLFNKFNGVFDFDTLLITESYAEYEERMQPDRAPGLVFFNIDTVLCRHLTNRPEKPPLQFYVKARPMGTGSLHVNFDVPRADTARYSLNGDLSDFDLNKMNSILKSGTLMEFTAGRVRRLDFAFNYDNNSSAGKLKLDLDTFGLVVYKKKSPDKRSMLKTMILSDVLDDKIGDTRNIEGVIGYTRDKRRSVFHFWWQSLLSGFRQAMGIDQKSLDAANDD